MKEILTNNQLKEAERFGGADLYVKEKKRADILRQGRP
jgi:hypothetical protein